MYPLKFYLKLYPKPRPRFNAKNGRAYHTKEYKLYQETICNILKEQLPYGWTKFPDQFYIGLMSVYIPHKRGGEPDLIDNQIGGLLDAFKIFGLIKDDNRKCAIGDKILSYPVSDQDVNYLWIGNIREIPAIDDMVTKQYYKAIAGVLD